MCRFSNRIRHVDIYHSFHLIYAQKREYILESFQMHFGVMQILARFKSFLNSTKRIAGLKFDCFAPLTVNKLSKVDVYKNNIKMTIVCNLKALIKGFV